MKNTILISSIFLLASCASVPIWVKKGAPPRSTTGQYLYFMGSGKNYEAASADAVASIASQYGDLSVSSITTVVDQWDNSSTGNTFSSELQGESTIEKDKTKYSIYPVERYQSLNGSTCYILLAITDKRF